MAALFPITLTGDNLGQRHRHLNRLVNDAYLQGISFSSFKDLPETSALDRIFKIDLASKYRDADYIIENLKHEDMLYVSKALKCTWLLDAKYSKIVDPTYLENVLYFEMTVPAVTKMKHWIELNLKDPERSQSFYNFYIRTNFDAAINFLQKCCKKFILSEISKENILEQLEPHHLKLLIEKCSVVATVFFSNLETNYKLLKKYLDSEFKYYDTLKYLLKVNGDIVLNITEKYFNENKFRRFSPEATKYIMINYKQRFIMKPELYTSLLLDIKTLAKHLSTEDIKDLIVKLARAAYLQHWFSFKNIQPLLKSLSVEERTSFKKVIFVEKDFGKVIENWPYEIPSSPELKNVYDGSSVFMDKEHDPREYDYLEDEAYSRGFFNKRKIKKKKGKFLQCDIICKRKSSLDLLFDRYRFVSFEKTMFELRKQLNVESLQHRQNIMLVLISKSGGRAESLEELLKFLTDRHVNEPEHLRATVIRSLIRRCSAWRLSQHVWELLLKFGRGVGLDGNTSTVACNEGVHAVIIRNIVLDQEIDPAVWTAFMDNFSTFEEYSLNVTEKQKIATKLPELLVSAAEKEPIDAIDCLDKALDTIDAYKIRVDKCPNLVAVISETAHKNAEAEKLLRRLFYARIARKQLFKENFAVIQNNASYYNALKNDVSVLLTGEAFEDLIKSNELKHDGFITTLSLYFNEQDGLASKYYALLKRYMNDETVTKSKLARYIAILSGEELEGLMKEFNDVPKKSDARRFAAALRANCHLARPLINLNEFEFKKIGAKAVANRVLKCSMKHVEFNVQVLMTWNRTQKLALVLSIRIGKEVSIVKSIAEKRQRFALKIMLQYLKRKKFDEEVWDIIVTIVEKLDKTNVNDRLRKSLSNVELVPAHIKAKYCTAVFKLFQNRKVNKFSQLTMLCIIEQILPEIDATFIETVVKIFLNEEFTSEKLSETEFTYDTSACLFMRIVAKYLLQCKSDIEQKQKWENLGKTFFDHFDEVWKTAEKKSNLMDYLSDFFLSLKYTRIFLDTEYVSCLPMFERIINRLQNVLPLHEYFEKYIRLHLTMIYFKSVRQSIKNNPAIFENLPKYLNQAAEIVGRIFGKLISHEVVELIARYFESVIEIYKRELRGYLETYFEYGESKNILIINVVRSILEYDNNKVHLLAEHIYSNDRHSWPEEVRKELSETLMGSKSIEVQFVFKAHLQPW